MQTCPQCRAPITVGRYGDICSARCGYDPEHEAASRRPWTSGAGTWVSEGRPRLSDEDDED